MKKILIITNEFIPYSKSLGGIIRVLSFADYLTKNNIEVHILTSKNRFYGYFGYEKTIENIKMHYVDFSNNHNLRIDNNNRYSIINKIKYLLSFFIKKIKYSLILYGFDQARFKLKRYKIESAKIIEENKIKYAIISSPPFSLFFLSNFLKKRFSETLLFLDYRDSWTLRYEFKIFNLLQIIAINFLEKKIVSKADYIFCATTTIFNRININFSHILKNKPIIVLNGFHKINSYKKKKNGLQPKQKIHIGYFGMFNDDESGYRDIGVIYDSIFHNKLILDKFIFHFYGPSFIKKKYIKDFKNFVIYPSLNHDSALLKMSQMDYLLVLHTEEFTAKEVLTGKLFDYISVQVPILVISKGETEAGKLVEDHHFGININLSIKSLENSLFELINKPYNFNLNKSEIMKFSRNNQNSKILNIIN